MAMPPYRFEDDCLLAEDIVQCFNISLFMHITGKEELVKEVTDMQDNKHSVDKGYAWVILAVSFFSHLVIMGLTHSVGIFYTMIYESLELNSHTLVALAPSIFQASFYVTGKHISLLLMYYQWVLITIN